MGAAPPNRKVNVTLKQIAERLEISQATVSRVLNRRGLGFISLATRERVELTAAEMGYRPNQIARGLSTGRTNIVALWIRNPTAPYYAAIVEQMAEHAALNGYEMILRAFRDRGDDHGTPAAIDPLAVWPVDGLFAVDVRAPVDGFLHAVGRAIPFVGMGNDFPAERDHVSFDAEAGVRDAVEHLLESGCRKIVHLSAGCSIRKVRLARADIFERVITDAGMTPIVIKSPNETRIAARHTIAQHVREHGCPDGVFCINDDVAIGAHRGLLDLGKRVPQDVKLVGFDAIADGELLATPLTSVNQPVDELVTNAWEFMKRRMQSATVPQQTHVVRPRLLIRESTTARHPPPSMVSAGVSPIVAIGA
ncbi:MAG: LacI family DNA-binding transcriptional regulator [Phycisphaerae bacterium]